MGLQGWTTENPEDPNAAGLRLVLARTTGVVMAISYRGACNTNPPPPSPRNLPNIRLRARHASRTTVGRRTRDVDTFCNQGAPRGGELLLTRPASPNRRFSRGFTSSGAYRRTSPANGPPGSSSAYLDSPAPARTFAQGNSTRPERARSISLDLDVGSAGGSTRDRRLLPPGPQTRPLATRRTSRSSTCKVTASANNNNIVRVRATPASWSTTGDGNGLSSQRAGRMPDLAPRRRNAVAIQVRLQKRRSPNAAVRSDQLRQQVRALLLRQSADVNTEPTQGRRSWTTPVQRAFRGNTGHGRFDRCFVKADREPACPGGTDE